MKRILFINWFLWVGIGLFAQNNQFVLNGTIQDRFNDKYIMLFTFKGDSINSTDTTIVRNGHFTFTGKEYLFDEAILSIGNYPDEVQSVGVILERGNIYIEFKDSIETFAFGTSLNDSIKNYYIAMEQWSSKVDSSIESGLYTSQDINYLLNPLLLEKFAIRENFMLNNISNVAGKILFKKVILKDINMPYFDKIYALIDDELKLDPVVARRMYRWEEDLKKRSERNETINHRYIDFEFKTPNGESHKLSEYVGKSDYLFVDFWASWCGPCIADMPYLKDVYNKYKAKGLDVISISLDDKKNAWLNAIARVDVPWVHLSDLQGSRSQLTEAYSILGIPYAILLDREGTIININLTGRGLDNVLEELINGN
jgi:thiol-disulfide isomerase/thioredoxin